MKKYILILLLAFSGSLFAQPPATGTTKAGKFQMNFPDLGTKSDSVVLWNGTDKILKYIPASVFGGSQNLQQTVDNGGSYIVGDDEFYVVPGGFVGQNSVFGASITLTPQTGLVFSANDGTSYNSGVVIFKNSENRSALRFENQDLDNSINSNLEVNAENIENTDAPGEPWKWVIPASNDRFAGEQWVTDNFGSGGATNLSYTPSPTNGTINSDTGTDAVITLADGTNAGLLSPAMKTKVDGIATGATANTGTVTNVTGVSGETTVANGTTTPVIGIAAAYTTARNTYADGKVVNALSGSETDKAASVSASKAYFQTLLTNSDGLAAALSDETGYSAGALAVFNNSPLITGTMSIMNIANPVTSLGFLTMGTGSAPVTVTRNTNNSAPVFRARNLSSASTGNSIEVDVNIGGVQSVVAGFEKSGNGFGPNATAANHFVTLGQLGTVNNTTVPLTKASLNSTYPNERVGYIVQCPLITTGAMIYIKNSEAGSSDVWLSIVATVTP